MFSVLIEKKKAALTINNWIDVCVPGDAMPCSPGCCATPLLRGGWHTHTGGPLRKRYSRGRHRRHCSPVGDRLPNAAAAAAPDGSHIVLGNSHK
jgi:hypothetical protein